MLYVLLVTLFKPAAAPALPLEARTFREPSGTSGSTSVLVLTALAVVVGVVVDLNYNPGGPLDERLVVSIGAAISFAFVLAVIN
ncbi:hypothetical protein ABTF39_20285, partial [Acinetobacter baumannii]